MAKILLVDDDLQLTIMLKMLLEGEKYDVQVCNRGLDAQEALEAQFFDVIVLDWELPDTSGPEICRVFRERGGTEPILMLTTRSAPSVEEVSLDSGADDYLVKPFDPRELFARLKALLRSTTVPAPPPRKTSAQGLANPPDIDAAFKALADRYDDFAQIGKGAMGLVFKAKDRALNRPVALKILHPYLVPDSQSLEKFKREAQAVAQLSHPNIVIVYDSGVTPNGLPYLAMEYLNGSSLADVLLREHQIHPKQAVKIFKQLCEALVHCHGKGIIHGNLKPTNLMFQMIDPGVYLLKLRDFGMAELLKQPAAHAPNLSRKGEAFGTPLYLSPEQSLGLAVDQRSDIFSLGYIFYECVTGIKLFLGDDDLDTMHKRTVDLPLPFALVRPDLNLPSSLESLIFKALAIKPKDRYQTASELKWALDALSRTEGSILT